MGQKWKGGDDMANNPGGGHKINLLKEEMENFKDNPDQILMFTDSYDVIFLAEPSEIIAKFKEFKANLVFGAESFCWPDSKLADSYPVPESGKRFLNSGGFIGYAKDIYALVNFKPVQDSDDDQLYYTQLYLNEAFREKHQMVLDHKSRIFQNLNGATDEVELVFDDINPKILNTLYDTKPLVLHGNGPSKRVLNSLANYVPGSWNMEDQCTACWEDPVSFEDMTEVSFLIH